MMKNRVLAPAGIMPVLLLLLVGLASAGDDIITTVVGGGNADGYPATNAHLSGAIRCICGPDGSIYISEWYKHCIRKVAAGTGIISTFAGNGQIGSAGLGGPAINANIVDPCGMAFDAANDLYITDRGSPSAGGNHRVCKITMSTGIITLVAGNGSVGFSGDGGLATSAQFNWPTGIAFDAAGNLYIADQKNHRVRKVDAITKIVTTVAGDGTAAGGGDGGAATSAQLNNPNAVSCDAAGNVYISDEFNHRIRKITNPGPTGIISTVAGNGTSGFSGDGGNPISAQMVQAGDVWVDTNGDVYLVDVGNHRVRLVSGGLISTIAGGGISGGLGDGGPATSARFGNFWSVVLTMDAAKNVVVADYGNNRIRMVTRSTGKIDTIAGGGNINGVPATAVGNFNIVDVAVDPVGNRYFAARYVNRIYRMQAGTGLVSVVAGNGDFGMSGDGGPAVDATLNGPSHLAVDGVGNLYVSSVGSHRVRRIDLGAGMIYACAGSGSAGFSGDGASATLAQLNGPKGLVCDTANNLFIVDSANYRIRRVPAGGGNITTVVGSGSAVSSGDGGTAITAGLATPEDLAFTAAGSLVIVGADIRSVVLSGATNISTLPVALGGRGVAINGAGDLFISSSASSSVKRVAAGSYSVSTVCAGSGSDGFSGDGGSASAALLNGPAGLAFDQGGNLLIADNYNGRIRQVAFAGAALNVTAANATRVYGATNPAFTGTITGLVAGDVITGTYSSSATTTTPVGTYGPASPQAITATLVDPGSRLSNYQVTATKGTLTITPATLTITAVDATMVAGQSVPTLTALGSGLVGTDSLVSLDTPPVITTTATSASLPGSYPITITAAADTDYTITQVGGTLTVTPASAGGSGNGGGSSGGGSCGIGGGLAALLTMFLLSLGFLMVRRVR